MLLSNLMVVDIETIPDTEHHEGDGFPKLPFHQVVAVAFLHAGIKREGDTETYKRKDIRCGGDLPIEPKHVIARQLPGCVCLAIRRSTLRLPTEIG